MNWNSHRAILLFTILTSLSPVIADEANWCRPALGDLRNLDGWTGLISTEDGAVLVEPGEAIFRYPDGAIGWFHRGLRTEHDGSRDWRDYYGLQVEVQLTDSSASVDLTALVRIPPQRARSEYVQETHATIRLQGIGNHTITIPWSQFDFFEEQPAFLKFVKELRLNARAIGGKGHAKILIKDVRLIRAPSVALRAAIKGKSIGAGGVAQYEIEVANCTGRAQSIGLAVEKHGWQTMQTTIDPPAIELEPDQTAKCIVRVKVPDRIPPGGQEKQIIRAVASGDGSNAATVMLTTASALPHPHILHTPERWQEVRDKVKKYDWAKQAQDDVLQRADRWSVPDVAKLGMNLTGVDDMGPFLFNTAVEHDLMASGIAYQLTGESKYAEKVRTFMLRLSDPATGYPATMRGCNQSLVQEGHFFQHIAMAYDMALSSGVFTDADKSQIETTLRMFIETIEFETSMGSINNWNLSELTGALYCSLVLQDLSEADRFLRGPAGAIDQLAHGVLDDGWWYECAISYNVWCASEFTQIALAMEPWGVNFKDMSVPVGLSKNYSLRPFDNVDGLYGQSFQKWGPLTHNDVNIKRMWDALPRFADYRGVMFAVNDATEARLGRARREIGAQPFELAYYVYRDPSYAAIIKQGGGKRDLLYGVPELPEKTPERFRDSAYADNVGVAMLRSQAPDRPIDQQIQAVLHYGTHGGFHGHFDRTELLHLSRFGRSFFNPEMVWYGYASYMYKFYVQNSTSKNMVVVDRKMQEPVESERLLWHTGKLFQATAVQTNARWSAPPYGGMVYPEQRFKSLQDKAWSEGRFLPKPQIEPEYGSVTEFTEPILQRRLMIVTDDYVVLADYLKGIREHTFESLLQMKGFIGIEAADKKTIRHDSQWDANPILDAQFVTDCDWYSVSAPAKATFEQRWGARADNDGTRTLENEEGVLKLDVYTLWPAKQELMVGTVPEDHSLEKRLFWSVRGDGKKLAEGKFGAWILGEDHVDVSVQGMRELELETQVEISKNPTIFWANTRVVTSAGKEIPLSALPVEFDNIVAAKEAGKDYLGGPVKIVGKSYDTAIAGQPRDDAKPGIVRVNLSGVDAARFKTTVGGDYPLGNEGQRRKTYASKVIGNEARFITIIEPFEKDATIKRVSAESADKFRVELNDGRVQAVTIAHFDGNGKNIHVSVTEGKDGGGTRTETTP